MSQEELKTCLGQLLLDLRGNWAFYYYDRLIIASDLCKEIDEDLSDILESINIEKEGEYDGRIFRNCSYYGYFSEEGTTNKVKEWLKNNLSLPENYYLIEEYEIFDISWVLVNSFITYTPDNYIEHGNWSRKYVNKGKIEEK